MKLIMKNKTSHNYAIPCLLFLFHLPIIAPFNVQYRRVQNQNSLQNEYFQNRRVQSSLLLSKTSFNAIFSRKRLSPLYSNKPAEENNEEIVNNNENYKEEEVELEPEKEMDIKRRLRKERERFLQERFVSGNELIELREQMFELEKDIKLSKRNHDKTHVRTLQKQLRELRSKDAEFVYAIAKKEMEDAQLEERNDVEKWKQIALDARSCIPHFNLEGLWVGKYGSHGYEMINITYIGDNLIAYKVTGDRNVPKGEITFQADLTPIPIPQYSSSATNAQNPYQVSPSTSTNTLSHNSRIPRKNLEPIHLTETAAKQWGVKKLLRFPGLGHVASENFENNQWLDGQFIMIGQHYFSFAWVPIGHQIFFGRPSPDLILKMIRDENLNTNSNEDDDVTNMRVEAERSMRETLVMMDEYEEEDECDLFEGGCFQ